MFIEYSINDVRPLRGRINFLKWFAINILTRRVR